MVHSIHSMQHLVPSIYLMQHLVPSIHSMQHLVLMDQSALLGRKANTALLDPPAHQVPLAPQEELPMSAGGGRCARVSLEQAWSTMASLQALTSQT